MIITQNSKVDLDKRCCDVNLRFDNIVSLNFSIDFSYIELFFVFIENLQILIDSKCMAHERFSYSFYTENYRDYSLELYQSYMKIEVRGRSGTTFEIILNELEDLKFMKKILNEIYEILNKQDIPERYDLCFQ